MEDTEQTTDLTDEQIDTLVGDSEKPSEPNEIPMHDEPKAAAPAPESQKESLLEFTHNGRPIKAPVDQVIKWAQQGYDYPQKMNQFNQEKQTWDKQRSDWENQWGVYKQIDEYAKTNPEWWGRVQQQFQNKDQVQQNGQPDPYAPKFQNIESKLTQIEQFAQTMMAERQAKQREQEDKSLETEIKSIRDNFKDLDFDRVDQEGKSLEWRILDHAQKNGIPSFRAAFRDFYHDNLVARAENLGKQTISHEVQKRSKLGVLGESPTPKKGISEAQDIKNKSYEELSREALEELGIGA